MSADGADAATASCQVWIAADLGPRLAAAVAAEISNLRHRRPSAALDHSSFSGSSPLVVAEDVEDAMRRRDDESGGAARRATRTWREVHVVDISRQHVWRWLLELTAAERRKNDRIAHVLLVDRPCRGRAPNALRLVVEDAVRVQDEKPPRSNRPFRGSRDRAHEIREYVEAQPRF